MGLVRVMLVALVVMGCGVEEKVEEEDSLGVRGVFERYRDAVAEQDAQAMINALDSSSIARYGGLRELALSAGEPEVRALPLLDRFLVLALRHRLSVDSLRALTPLEVAGYTLRPGWTGDTAVQRPVDLGRIYIDGEEASAEAYSQGDDTGQLFFFRKQSAEWKVDLVSTAGSISGRIESILAGSAVEQERILSAMIEHAVGGPLRPELWRAPVPSGTGPDDTPSGR